MIKDYLEIGQIVGTHGVRGELRVQPWCDSPEFFKSSKHCTTTYTVKKRGRCLRSPPRNIALLRLDGCDTVEKAASLRGKVLYMRRSDVHLKKGDWFIAELIGCRAEDTNSGKVYGTVTDVSQTGANDVWHITDDNGTETLIPAIPDVVSSVDVESGIVLITPLKGLFSDED